MLPFQRTLLTRALSSSSSCARRRLAVHKHKPLLIRRIHISNPLFTKEDQGGSGSDDYDNVLRNIILQTSLGDNLRRFPEVSKGEEGGGGGKEPVKKEGEEEGGEEDDKEPTNLLITLDALGTLYEIKNGDLGKQYALVAEECGLKGLDPGDVARSFKEVSIRGWFPHFRSGEDDDNTAFKELSKSHPNYGYHTEGMTPRIWWDKVTKRTFTPLLPTSTVTKYPTNLAEALWTHFCTDKGYSIFDGTIPFLWNIKDLKAVATRTREGQADWKYRTITIGVISNSDARVAGVLSSMGIAITHRAMSQDGELKKRKAKNSLRRQGSKLVKSLRKGWDWYHVGDNKEEDVAGAYEAGGVGILFDRNKEIGETETIVEGSEEGIGYKAMVIGDLREVAEFTEGLSILYKAGGEKVPYPRRLQQPR
ncbi:hypothetical protein TWF106_006676 [Orbilia oligospora]|uniref:Uncharacterized protein n=1 Tax=Orbilia oligospora TaxID=2813651 RepID=A0A7C8QP68_ORBOL|nr:hypothetical protein TWF106_006676 [Orbilia oligospora]